MNQFAGSGLSQTGYGQRPTDSRVRVGQREEHPMDRRAPERANGDTGQSLLRRRRPGSNRERPEASFRSGGASDGATTDRRQQTKCLEPEGRQVVPANTRDNIVGQHFAFPGGMLCGGWLISSLFVWNHRTVTERPHSWKTLDSHRGVGLQAIAFLR